MIDRARLEEKLLNSKPGAIIYLTREEWQYMQDNAGREPILVEREKTHGDFSKTAHTSQTLKGIFRKRMLSSRHDEALDMIAVKLARILEGDFKNKDHWADIAGYAKLGEEACDGN